MMVKGEGCYLWDIENRRYLDFTAGIAVNALGHCDPETSKLIAQQVRPSDLAKLYTVLRIEHAGADTSTHLESLPQSLDRRTLKTNRYQNASLRFHAQGIQSFRLQLWQRSQRSRHKIRP